MATFPTIISINGVAFPKVPMQFRQSVYTLDRDSYEDLDGNLNRTILGERDKFEFTLPPMHDDVLQPILNQLKRSIITLVYQDFWDKSITRTGTFYHGDLHKDTYWIKGTNKTLYDQFDFNLISYRKRKINY